MLELDVTMLQIPIGQALEILLEGGILEAPASAERKASALACLLKYLFQLPI
jgi:hypothetical protein